ncbi:Arylsulfatase [termite gut metagenome]|uniref:Arylsulfatase n=1 Tax=termite gut metagenome TaxID=433724 RepID=A0A5J4SWZ8_9ZZZZ
MKNLKELLYLGLPYQLIISGCSSALSPREAAQPQPNIVIIYNDDMGYADISCYGQQKWQTPNIDKLSNEGIRFTDFYSASHVSSPSRAALLTGRYPARLGIQGVFFPDSYTGIPQEELLLSELLKSVGYSTAIVGKWHLGNRERYLPLQNGFDEYFGIPYSNDMSAQVFLRGNEVEEFHIDQNQMTKRYTQEAVNFISKQKENQPFFLYLAHNMMHVPIFCSEEFAGKSGHGVYGDAVLEIDWSIGQILKALEDKGLSENTLIIFSSDNGPWLQEGPLGGEAFPLREGKSTSYEGGVRVPAIAYWKGKIIPSVRNDVASTLDWYPTIAHLAGASVPDSIQLDGYDLSDLLLHQGNRESNQYVYFQNNRDATGIRIGDWKLSLPQKQINGNFWRASTAAHDTLLFNLKEDIGEKVNLYKKYPQKAIELVDALEQYKANLGELAPILVMYGNNQLQYLQEQRHNVIKEAEKRGIKSKAKQIDGFIEAE